MHQSINGATPWIMWGMLGLLAAQAMPLSAAEPPSEPILRLETGMHAEKIVRIDVDEENQYLVTGSDDKTIRLWELQTGKQIRVLRPPIGPGDEGKVYSVAISPDGRTIAAGGWMSASDDDSESIYLFDRATGRVRHRITGLPNVVFHLAFRPDGDAFVATLGSKGIRVFRTVDGAEIGKDVDYGDASYGADFDHDGRLVTSCYDGSIRLYSANYQKIATQNPLGGRRPVGVEFSPDGQSVAVGFRDSTAVNVLSGKDLSFLFSPDTHSVNEGDLRQVTWSRDGNALYAGGNAPIVRWGNAGRGSLRQLQRVTVNTLMGLKALRAGGVVYGTWEPAIGHVDDQGHEEVHGRTSQDFYATVQHFLLATDGETIAYKPYGKPPAHFSIQARALTLNQSFTSKLTAPRITSTNLSIEDWNRSYNPTLNGKPIKLDDFESSRSVAISHDDESFLLGTEWNLRFFDRTGTEIWRKPAPDIPWSINIPPSNSLAVIAFADGTIRWYRLRDGEELLAFFPHPDNLRWILWTPQGYYDASVGAEDLLGWHVNQGKEREAIFYPVAQFRNRFYRPDVISLVLQAMDVSMAVSQANAAVRLGDGGVGPLVTATGSPRAVGLGGDVRSMLQPIVEILSPQDGSIISNANLVIEYQLLSPNAEAVDEVKVYLDGRAVGINLEPLLAGQKEVTGRILVSIPDRDCTIGIVAKNLRGTSEMKTTRIRWGLPTQGPVHATLRVLAIGVGNYPDNSTINRLTYPPKDAQQIASLLDRQRGGGLYEAVETTVLIDEKANREAILDELERLQKTAGNKDVTMVFLAGHGLKDVDGEYYFLSVDADKKRLKRTALRGRDLRESLTTIPGKVIFFIDTCYAGGLLPDIPGTRGEGNASQVNVDELANELANTPGGPIVFASSTGRQLSLERDDWKNGAFSKALLEAFQGKADLLPPTGVINVTELESYLAERVAEITVKKQTPRTILPKGIDPYKVALVR